MAKTEKVILNSTSIEVATLMKKDKRLAKVISLVGSIEYSVHQDNYSFLVHEIIEQMLSVKAGNQIYNRLLTLCDGSVTPETINVLTNDEIKSIGTARSKVLSIRALTNEIISGKLDFDELKSLPDNEVVSRLMKIRGIGWWTAKMYLIFVLDRPDVLPSEDVAFQQVYKWLYKTEDVSKKAIEAKCRKWKPYSSTAARYFYRALDMGLTKQEFHLFK